MIAKKVEQANQNNITPLVCVQGPEVEVPEGCKLVAYEPIWAIGTGKTATSEQAQEMHAFIRAELRKIAGGHADEVPILYGGSCKPDNAEGLFAGADVNGGLIGGASLLADQFTALVTIAQQVKG